MVLRHSTSQHHSSLTVIRGIHNGEAKMKMMIRSVLPVGRKNFVRPAAWSNLGTSSTCRWNSSSSRRRSEETRRDDDNYCINLVRERDQEGFLCGLLLPKKSQRAYYAIRAFNVELASIKDGSSLRRRSAPDQAPGGDSTSTNMTTSLALQMRMQWWRDAVQAIYEDEDETVLKSMKASPTTPDHLINLSISCWNSPVVRALDRAHAEMNLTRRFLERLIDAREMDLDVRQHASLEEAVSYAEDSVSSLLYLSLECTGVRDDQADIVASHAGVGIGLTNTCLRAMRFRLSQGEISLPAELFPTNFSYQGLIQSIQNSAASNDEDDSSDKTNLDPKDLAIVNEAINHVANEALAHLQTARDIQGQVPKHGRSALLPVVPAIHYLNLWNECSPKDDRLKGLLMAQTQQEQKRLSLLLFLGRAWLTGVI